MSEIWFTFTERVFVGDLPPAWLCSFMWTIVACLLSPTASAALLPVVLVDNGSKRPASALALRASASALSELLSGHEVRPASLAFSDSIPAATLGGTPARTLSDVLSELSESGAPGAIVAPLFLGPSDALRRGVSSAASALPESFRLLVGAPLVDESTPKDRRVARALAARVLRLARQRNLASPLSVLLVDHGTPSPRVHAVRTRLADEVRELLGDRARHVGAASMERREGEAYDFNEPLLERALLQPPFDEGEVVLAMAFLLPGRHAGEGGDVEQIVRTACENDDHRRRRQSLRVHTTAPLGCDSLVLSVLADRVRSLSGLR